MNFNFDLQRFGSGGGGHKSTGKLVGSIAFGLLSAGYGFFGAGVGAFARFAMGASLFSSVWTATHKDAVGSLDITRFDREQETMSSTAQIPVVYGMRKVTGNQTFHDTNSDANTLHKHVVLCEGGIEGIVSVCANDLLIPTGTQSTGTVFTLQNMKYTDATVKLNGKHLYLHANGVDHDIYLCNKDDTSGSYWSYQVSISGLISYLNRLNEGWQAFPMATTNKYPGDLRGVGSTACYRSVVDFTSDTVTGGTTYTFHDGDTPDNYETVGGYPDLAWLDMTFQVSDELNGNPSVDCIVKGRKVYDSRTKTTAYSTNPAMCLRDFLLSSRYGLGKWFTDDDLDEDSWKESADYCDESVTFTNSDGSKETAKRYELNIVIDQQQSALQWLQTLLANFCGYIVYSNGKLKLCIEKPTVTSYKFNDDNCSDLKIEPLNLTETPNRYEVSLVDPLNNWATVKAICEDLADQKLRQHIVTKEVSLEGVTSQHQALRLARFYRDYNLVCPLQFSFTTGMQGMSLEPGDVVTVSYHGVFTDMPMRISEIKETSKGTFEISGRQYNSTIYSDDLGGGVHWYNYSTTKTSLYPQKPTNVKAVTKYRTYADGSTGYDVIVTYSLPAAYDVETGLVYYKLNHETGENIVFDEGVAADEAGYSSPWSYAGDSATSCTISGAKLGDIYRIKVITRNRGGYLSDDSDIVTVTVTEKATVPAQPQNLSYDFTDDFTFSWNDVADTDAVYYEVICGSILLARTKYTTATVKLTERKATVDVYAVNSQGKRSYPAEISYDVPKPVAPASITFTEIPIGVKITVSDFPLNCHEMHLKIEGNTLTLNNATYSFQGDAGIYDVSAAYVDLFGEGEWSQTFAMTVKPVFKAEWVADESISLAKVDSAVKAEIASASGNIPRIDQTIADVQANATKIHDSINTNMEKMHSDINTDMATMKADINTDINAMESDISGIHGNITDLQKSDDSITAIVAKNKTDQDGINAQLTTKITETADGITATVAKNKSDGDAAISQVNQRCDSITATVAKNKSDGDTAISQVSQKADSISATITANLNETDPTKSAYKSVTQLATQIKQTADSITSTVASNKSAQDSTNSSLSSSISQVSQKADSISATITANLNETDPTKSAYKSVTQLATQIKQTADSITSTVASNKSTQDATNSSLTSSISQVSQKADTISATVSANKSSQDNENSSLQSQISQNASSISSVVSSLNTTDTANSPYKSITALQSQVTQTANSLTSTISAYQSADSSLSSSISQVSQRCDSISSTVQSNKTAQDATNSSLSSSISQVNQRCDSISSTVQSNKSSTDTSISNLTQTASDISSTVQRNKTAQDATNSSLSSQINQQSDRISSVITNLGKAPADSGYSAITQLQDAVNLRVSKGDVINQINLTAEGTTIDGKYLHVTGTTKFDSGVIVNSMLAANAVTADKISAGSITADKLSVNSLSAVSATIGVLRTATSGARTEISDNLICVYDGNNVLRVKMGVWE